jgi:peptidyl-prolyl cis-trans isomerase D
MATLQKIRNRAGVAIMIFIFMALAAFILGDLFKSGDSIMRGKQMELAEIAGNTVTYPEFQKRVDELSEIYKMNSGKTSIDANTMDQIREQTWQVLVRNLTMKDIYKKLGIGVSSTELFDLVQGKNPSPIIQSIFRDPNTGTINRPALMQFLKYQQSNVGGKEHNYWLFLENQIEEERNFEKYNDLLSKGLYVTNAEAKDELQAANHQVNIQFVSKLYSSVPDNDIKVSDSELQDYYNKHKDNFKQDDTRSIEYVNFPVVPSKADEEKLIKWINDIKTEFASVEDPAAFVNLNSDIPFDPGFYKKEELSPELGEFAFSHNVGEIYGPYKEKNSWKLAKILKFEDLPDSVEARHILIRVNSAEEAARATKTIDSLKNLIQKGAKFEDVARTNSQDPGSANNGGSLGWFRRGMMVKPFEDAAFFGKAGELQVVNSQFGVHLLQVTNRGKLAKNVQLAIIDRNITPSSQTYQATYTQASKFVSSNPDEKKFNDQVKAQGLDKKIAQVHEGDKDIAGMENSRVLVRAAFKADKGSLIMSTEGTPIFELGDQFVVAVLTDIQKEGIAPFNAVKSRIELAVKKEKKAQQLMQKMSGKTDLTQLASEMSTTVGEANDVSFDSYSIQGVGNEPAIAGAASILSVGQVSKPLEGNNGVYVVKVTSEKAAGPQDLASEKFKLAAGMNYRANTEAFQALKEYAKIVDKRAKFY